MTNKLLKTLKGNSVMLQKLFNKVADGVNSTTFLTGVGVTGTVSTAYFSGRASFKAARLIDRDRDVREATAKRTSSDVVEATTKDKVKLIWPLYVAPVSVGATTILAIVMANQEASKKITALTVASGISERALVEYKAKVAEKIGKAKQTAIRDEIAQDHVNENPPVTSQVMMVGDTDVLCHDMLTGRYFVSNMEKIRQAMNNVNYEVIAHEYASLSFFYDEIGLAPTAYSDYVGWRVDDHPEVTFSTVMSPDGRPCIAVDFDTPPHPGYSHLY